MDVTCRKCGEPWDYYGAMDGDMEPGEWARFKRGEGCPACGFGTICTQCNGSGKEPVQYGGSCPACLGRRTVLIHRCGSFDGGAWHYGYQPRMVRLAAEDVARLFLRDERGHECSDGWVEQKWIRCPLCWDEAPPCAWCGGTGAPAAKSEDEDTDATIEFLASLVDVCEGDEVFEAVDALEREARTPVRTPATTSEVATID